EILEEEKSRSLLLCGLPRNTLIKDYRLYFLAYRGAVTWSVSRPASGLPPRTAWVVFKSQEARNEARKAAFRLDGCVLTWAAPGEKNCFTCGDATHLAAACPLKPAAPARRPAPSKSNAAPTRGRQAAAPATLRNGSPARTPSQKGKGRRTASQVPGATFVISKSATASPSKAASTRAASRSSSPRRQHVSYSQAVVSGQSSAATLALGERVRMLEQENQLLKAKVSDLTEENARLQAERRADIEAAVAMVEKRNQSVLATLGKLASTMDEGHLFFHD
ncbi:hypothetical protein H9P43_010114, partial [Blastocladiella emersonii ATCC 22665]